MIIHRSTEKEKFFFKRTRVTTCLVYLILCILAIQNPSVKKRNKANRVIWVILNSKNNTKTYSSLGSRPISSYDRCYYIYCRHFVFRMQYEAVSQRIFKYIWNIRCNTVQLHDRLCYYRSADGVLTMATFKLYHFLMSISWLTCLQKSSTSW